MATINRPASLRNILYEAEHSIKLSDVEYNVECMKKAGVPAYNGKYYFLRLSAISPNECSEIFKNDETIVVMRDGTYWHKGKQLSEKELVEL